MTDKILKLLDKVPYKFWALITIALSAGLLSILIMYAFNSFSGDKTRMDYPVYETLMKTDAGKQPEFYKKIAGAWYIKQDTTEMILELYTDGYFSWESIDSSLKYLKLFAAGRYALNESGQILFSQRQELGLPYDPYNPGLKIHHLAIRETPFSFKIRPRGNGTPPFLILSIPKEEGGANPAIIRFLQAISKNKDEVYLRYLGKPARRLPDGMQNKAWR